jgi:hypothetical protein
MGVSEFLGRRRLMPGPIARFMGRQTVKNPLLQGNP